MIPVPCTFYTVLRENNLHTLADSLTQNVRQAISSPLANSIKHMPNPARYPALMPSLIQIDKDVITIGHADDITAQQKDILSHMLKQLHPWRKGPYCLFGIMLDTEWRSDYKWNRLKNHIDPLAGKTVLDVGCGNGYYSSRMRGTGAHIVLGIDPTWVYVMQYTLYAHYLLDPHVAVLPLRLKDMPPQSQNFDTVFSMGLLYHALSPIEHLKQLYGQLKKGGQLIVETLIVDGPEGTVLTPKKCYAAMPNVWFIPSPSTLIRWLKRVGFSEIYLLDITATTPEEQRRTTWYTGPSLTDFLAPNDAHKTIEGYPSPQRAIFLARR